MTWQLKSELILLKKLYVCFTFTFTDIITNISSYSSQQKRTDCDGEFESDYV